jgi:hypothetical protein
MNSKPNVVGKPDLDLALPSNITRPTNILLGKTTDPLKVLNSSNIVIGQNKSVTPNGTDFPLSATVGSVVIGNGQFVNGAVVPNNCIMIGNGCAPPPSAGKIAFGGALTAVDGTPLADVANLDNRIEIAYNGARYYLYLQAI